MRERIGADHHAAADLERDMPLGVAGRVERAHAGDDVVARLEDFHLLFDRAVAATSTGDKAGALGRQAATGVVALPEIPFGGGDVTGNVRQRDLVELIERAPQMIGMAVGEYDLGDRALFNTGGL